eukprot:245500-Amphidinium_carterae.1
MQRLETVFLQALLLRVQGQVEILRSASGALGSVRLEFSLAQIPSGTQATFLEAVLAKGRELVQNVCLHSVGIVGRGKVMCKVTDALQAQTIRSTRNNVVSNLLGNFGILGEEIVQA